MTPLESIRAFVESGVKGLSTLPEAVHVESVDSGGRNTFIIIRCDSGDMSRVIGKGSKNLNQLRELAQAMARKHDLFITVVLEEKEALRSA